MNDNGMIAISRKPTHPGEMLKEEFFPAFGLTVSRAASLLHVSRQSVNELLRERRGVSADMAVRLSRLFGTSPQYWLNMQRNIDIWNAFDRAEAEYEEIEPIAAAAM